MQGPLAARYPMLVSVLGLFWALLPLRGWLPSASVSDLPLDDHEALAAWCLEQNVALVVVGPEDPLASGVADRLQAAGRSLALLTLLHASSSVRPLVIPGVDCFGPSARAAEIEANKAFAKDFMLRHSIPTARGQPFTCLDEAQRFILR